LGVGVVEPDRQGDLSRGEVDGAGDLEFGRDGDLAVVGGGVVAREGASVSSAHWLAGDLKYSAPLLVW
jgi:hypothetical protein